VPDSGGGLYFYGSAATLSGNRVINKTASTASTGSSGGLYLMDSDAVLTDNIDHRQHVQHSRGLLGFIEGWTGEAFQPGRLTDAAELSE